MTTAAESEVLTRVGPGTQMGATQPPHHGGTRHVRPGTTLKRITGLLNLWRERLRARRHLRDLCQLDDHMLQDIGLTRSALRCEAEKPFWR
jgi:uncharacterized protein YjiS (DUF1127 family)